MAAFILDAERSGATNRGDTVFTPDTGREFVDIGNDTQVEVSQLLVAERSFTETTGAGTYTATVEVPAGYSVLDVRWLTTALWTAATSAVLNIGDADDADGYYAAIDLKTYPALVTGNPYGFTANSNGGPHVYGSGKYYGSGGTITATVTTVGATGSAGRSRMLVLMCRGNVSTQAATKS